MNSLERTIQRARARVTAGLALRGAGWGLTLGAAAGLVLLVADRLTGLRLPASGYLAIAAGGAVLGLVRACALRPGRTGMAVALDRQLALKDRLGTATTLDDVAPRGSQVFVDLARRDAQRVAESLDVRRVTPIRPTRIWMAAIAAAAALTVGFLALPEALGGGTRADNERREAATREQRNRILETIDEAMANIEKDNVDAQSRDELEMLERLAAQLDGVSAPQLNEARDQSAATLNDVAERMARDAERNIEAIDEATRRFGQVTLPPDVPETPSQVSEFADALRRGDLAEAAEKFDELLEEANKRSDDTRDTVADQLRDLASQLDEQADGDPETPSDGELQRALEDLGLDEQDLARQLEEPDAGDPPVDPETLRRLADDLERRERRQELDRAADERTRDLARALEEAADDLEHPERQSTDEQQTPQDAQEQRQVPRQEPSDGGNQEQPTQGDQQQGDGEQPAPGQGAPQDQPDGATPSEQPTDDPQGQPQPGERPGGEEMPGQRERAMREVSRLLREMEHSRKSEQERRELSEDLQKAARDLADTLSDEEKEQLARQWLGERGLGGMQPGEPGEPVRPQPWGGETEDLDLRGDERPDQTLHEWLADGPIEGVPQIERRQAYVGRARRAAEQAVEKSTVPSRYHDLIRRYFGRLPETVDGAAAPPSSSDARDRDGS